MNDVMKKRIVGAGVLIIIGILVPLFFAGFFHGDGGGDHSQQMRVYEVTPEGEARRANSQPQQASPSARATTQGERDGMAASRGAAGATRGEQSATEEQEHATPEPVSPQSEFGGEEGEEIEPPTAQGDPTPADPGQQATASQSLNAGPSPQAPPEARADTGARNDNGSLQRTASSDGWIVQVASFGDKSNAERLARELNSEFKAFYRAGDVNGKTYYRVRIGPFDTESDARAAAGRLHQGGRNTLVQRAG